MPGVCWPSEASCCSQAHVHVCQDGRHQARPDKSRKNADASEDNHHANDDDEGAKPASIIAEQDYLSAIGANKLRYSNRSAEVSRTMGSSRVAHVANGLRCIPAAHQGMNVREEILQE